MYIISIIPICGASSDSHPDPDLLSQYRSANIPEVSDVSPQFAPSRAVDVPMPATTENPGKNPLKWMQACWGDVKKRFTQASAQRDYILRSGNVRNLPQPITAFGSREPGRAYMYGVRRAPSSGVDPRMPYPFGVPNSSSPQDPYWTARTGNSFPQGHGAPSSGIDPRMSYSWGVPNSSSPQDPYWTARTGNSFPQGHGAPSSGIDPRMSYSYGAPNSPSPKGHSISSSGIDTSLSYPLEGPRVATSESDQSCPYPFGVPSSCDLYRKEHIDEILEAEAEERIHIQSASAKMAKNIYWEEKVSLLRTLDPDTLRAFLNSPNALHMFKKIIEDGRIDVLRVVRKKSDFSVPYRFDHGQKRGISLLHYALMQSKISNALILELANGRSIWEQDGDGLSAIEYLFERAKQKSANIKQCEDLIDLLLGLTTIEGLRELRQKFTAEYICMLCSQAYQSEVDPENQLAEIEEHGRSIASKEEKFRSALEDRFSHRAS